MIKTLRPQNYFFLLILFLAQSFIACEKEEIKKEEKKEEVIVEKKDSLPQLPLSHEVVAEKEIFLGIIGDSVLLPISPVRIAFNYPLAEVQKFDTLFEFRPVLLSLEISGSDLYNNKIEGDTLWNASRDTLIFIPKGLFPYSAGGSAEKPIYQGVSVKAKLRWEVKEGDDWKAILKEEAPVEEKASDTKEVVHFPRIINNFGFGVPGEINFHPFAAPQLFLNLPSDYEGEQIRVKSFEILHKVEEEEKPITVIQSDNKKIFYIFPEERFPPDESLPLAANVKYIAKATFERKMIDGEWIPLHVNDTLYEEIKQLSYHPYGNRSVDLSMEASPFDGEAEVGIFSQPIIKFSIPVMRVDSNSPYRLKLNKADILLNGQPVEAELIWGNDSVSLTFKPKEQLKENTKYSMEIEAQWERLKDGEWNSFDSELVFSSVTTFTTATEENSSLFLENDYKYSYPILLQYNFLQKEYPKGFLRVNSISPEVEEMIYSTDLYFRFLSQEGTVISEGKTTYASDSSTFHFEIPELENNTILKLEIGGLDKGTGIKVMQLVSYYFKTSHFDTFEEKLLSLNFDLGWISGEGGGSSYRAELGQTYTASEAGEVFDEAEIQRLLIFNGNLKNNTYFSTEVYPNLYKGIINYKYPLSRDTTETGLIPEYGIRLRQYPGNIKLSQAEIKDEYGYRKTYTNKGAVMYLMDVFYFSDYLDVYNYIYNKAEDTRNEWERAFMERSRVTIGSYKEFKYTIKYKIPGIEKVTSQKEMTLINPFGEK